MKPLFISLPKADNVKKAKSFLPLACLQLSAWLKLHGIESSVMDFSIVSIQEEDAGHAIASRILQAMSKEKPLFLGFNCFTTIQFPLLYAIVHHIKAAFPDVPVCIGGMHPSLFARDILLHCPCIDYIVLGEGEEQILALTRKLMGAPIVYEDIQAFGYRDERGEVRINERQHFLKDFEVPPAAFWGNIHLPSYHVNTSRWNNPKQLKFNLSVPIMTTRSCPFSCSFCSVAGFMGRTLRKRNPEHVLDEIQYVYETYGARYFEFIDDNINVDKKHAIAIFKGIRERGLNIHFSLTNGIHLASADEELIDEMVASGLAMIKFPIEHGSDYIRNSIIGKHLPREKIVTLARHIKQYDVFTFGLFIMGFPEETEGTLNATLELMDEISLDMYPVALLIPFPGTRVYKQCVKDGLLLPSINTQDLYMGKMILDAFGESLYIKPYNMSIDSLLKYKEKFEEKYIYTEKAKKMNSQ